MQNDTYYASFWLMGPSVLILALWFLWFFRAPIAIYEVATDVRVEVEQAVFTIAAPIDGVISKTHLVVGRRFSSGDTLVVLDDSVVLLSLKDATARYKKALADAQYAEEERTRWEKLHAAKLLSDIDLIKSRTDAEKMRETATGLKAEIELLEFRRKRHLITAPFGGIIGSVSPAQPGAILKEKDPLGTLIPAGDHKIVAYYHPARAVGRIQSGQTAGLKLDGFSWTQYGVVSAVVRNVASELVERGIKVEFDVVSNLAHDVALQHGMTGVIETLVGYRTPAELALSQAGILFNASPAPPSRDGV